MFGFSPKHNTTSNQYERTAKEAFKIANDLGTEVRHAMSRMTGLPEISQDVIMTASNTATALFEYAALQFRIKLRDTYDDKYAFEHEDNLMIETFAKTLMIPAIAFHKIITNQDDPETWENLLRQIPFPGINIDYYLNKINDLIDKAEV